MAPFLISDRPAKGGLWNIGWVLVTIGAAIYGLCLVNFLLSGGTPAIFFTRPVRFLLGEEPAIVVQGGLYRFSRNPMYIGVVTAIFGQALVFGSIDIALYGAAVWLFFHLAVVFIEEPHLRKERGAAYEEYCRRVPRWFIHR
jgi:protein-S-isoprenylcysteine O-methyltransferase Ste14